MCSIAKSFLKEKLKLSLSGNYTFSSTVAILSSTQKANMLTTRLSSNYALGPNGILQLNASFLSKQSPSNESYGANFTELSFNIGYRHTFSVVDLKFK
jgi:aspartate/tyrosine/aromatic aminotransferase